MSRGFFDKLKSDRLTNYLQGIQENIQYGEWYCGHMHENNRYKDDITSVSYTHLSVHRTAKVLKMNDKNT